MFRLTPTNPRFYEQFDRAADVTAQAAECFGAFLETFADPAGNSAHIKDLEHQVDDVVHETMALLHRSFITPLDRGDIRRLIEALDSIIDLIHASSSRIALYEIDCILPEARELARVLVQATQTVKVAVHDLRQLRSRNQILEHCREINRIEDEGDVIHRRAVADLFRSGRDPLTVMKWREIFEFIETAIDHCENVADVIEGIVLENA
ncbi:MAG: DUF47 family protein [Candidatus Latescibacterota bacterium]